MNEKSFTPLVRRIEERRDSVSQIGLEEGTESGSAIESGAERSSNSSSFDMRSRIWVWTRSSSANFFSILHYPLSLSLSHWFPLFRLKVKNWIESTQSRLLFLLVFVKGLCFIGVDYTNGQNLGLFGKILKSPSPLKVVLKIWGIYKDFPKTHQICSLRTMDTWHGLKVHCPFKSSTFIQQFVLTTQAS